jgi:ActR/RegA family two-component response regulator
MISRQHPNRKARKQSIKMNCPGKVLIADDEEIFCLSTADLLRREGYKCDCVPDANAGIIKLRSNEYDVLIADIRMPGNPNLEFIKALPRLSAGLSAILVTGYPSQNTAIEAVGLPVVAYMVKPIDLNQLTENVSRAVATTRLYRAVLNSKKQLDTWQEGLENLEAGLKKSNGGKIDVSEKYFIDLTFAGVTAALSNIRYIISTIPDKAKKAPVCSLMKCPRLADLVGAVDETIDVLEKTKGAFKSKELGRIRKKLETVVKQQ